MVFGTGYLSHQGFRLARNGFRLARKGFRLARKKGFSACTKGERVFGLHERAFGLHERSFLGLHETVFGPHGANTEPTWDKYGANTETTRAKTGSTKRERCAITLLWGQHRSAFSSHGRGERLGGKNCFCASLRIPSSTDVCFRRFGGSVFCVWLVNIV